MRPPPILPIRAASGFARQQPGGHEHRQAEPGIGDERQVGSRSTTAAAPSAAGARPARPLSRASRTTPAMTARPYHRRRRAGRDDVRRDRHQDGERHRPPRAAAERRPDETADDRDVPARDRDDVAHAGRGEVGRQRPIDPLAEPDEDARGEPCLRLGQGQAERVAAAVPQGLQAGRGRGDEAELPGVERSRRPRPAQIVPVRIVIGRWPEAPADLDDVARVDHGEGRQRGDDDDPAGLRVEAHSSDLVAVPWRGDRVDDGRPRAAALGEGRRHRGGRPDQHPHREQRGADADCRRGDPRGGRGDAPRPTDPDRAQPCREQQERRDAGRRRSAPTAVPTASHPARGKRPAALRTDGHERPDLVQRRGADDLARPSSSTAANGCSSRAATILAAVTGPMPGSVSSSSAVAVLRSIAVAALAPPLRRRRTAGRRLAADRDVDLVAVTHGRGQVELAVGQGSVDPRTVATRGGDGVRDA
jgi:hypothetical protein